MRKDFFRPCEGEDDGEDKKYGNGRRLRFGI